MPMFDYHCVECGYTREMLHRIDEAPSLPCPSCGRTNLTKGVSAPRFRLSGGGWYETDEKPKDKQRYLSAKESDSKAPTSTSSSEGGKSGSAST